MAIQIKVLVSREAQPSGGAYRHYIQDNIYGPDTDPPATLSIVRRALAEGWAIAWPPEPAEMDLRPLDPDLLLRALGPLSEGVHYLAGYCTGDDEDCREMATTGVIDSDAIHEPREAAPDAQGPDVQLAPVEAPETPHTTGAKPRKKGGR